jgi:hypothetical protein
MITLRVEVMGDRTCLTRSLSLRMMFGEKGEISMMMNKKTKSFSNITLKHFLLSWLAGEKRKETSTKTTPRISNHEKPIKNLIKNNETFRITQ